MNLLAIASMAAKLGIDIKLSAVLPLLPLLNKKPGELELKDVNTVSTALGFPLPIDVADELVNSINGSSFDTLADLLGSEKYATPLFSRLLMTKERAEAMYKPADVPVQCTYCERVNLIDRKIALDVTEVDVVCEACDSVKTISAERILSFGVTQ